MLLDFWGHLIQAFLFLHYFYILSTLNYLDLGTYVSIGKFSLDIVNILLKSLVKVRYIPMLV